MSRISQRPNRKGSSAEREHPAVTVRFFASDYQRLTEIAKKTDRSRGSVLRLLLRQTDDEFIARLSQSEAAR